MRRILKFQSIVKKLIHILYGRIMLQCSLAPMILEQSFLLLCILYSLPQYRISMGILWTLLWVCLFNVLMYLLMLFILRLILRSIIYIHNTEKFSLPLWTYFHNFSYTFFVLFFLDRKIKKLKATKIIFCVSGLVVVLVFAYKK